MKDIGSPAVKGRTSVVGGLFYPEEPVVLEDRILSYGLRYGVGGTGTAIIAPHAAWDISGVPAASAFSAVAGRGEQNRGGVSRVVLLGSVHDGAGEGLYLSDSQYFETPLGNLTVDQNLGAELASCSTLFEINDIPHLREHSLEVLLPFVRFCFPGARIIPLLMGVPRPSLVSALARALRIVFEPLLENTLFVISANLSKNHDGDLSRRQAEECIRLLQENDLPGFNAGIYNGALSICSGAMAAALLESGLLRGASPRLVSGPLVQTRADNDMIVHYGGLVF